MTLPGLWMDVSVCVGSPADKVRETAGTYIFVEAFEFSERMADVFVHL